MGRLKERCRSQNKCVVFSTHVMREAEKLCDRIAIIHEGRILADGSHGQLLERTGQPDLEEAFFSLVRPNTEDSHRDTEAQRRQWGCG